ncbi:DsrH/TusB family sulfur metabolism protein [Alkalimonas sp. MEB108]|uniref:DsrH/TusB family sulfur metabolism protein n=1 Tax=Alkalimonas cellulosilytica TaxID=3058395 RepID=A0ABU7J9U7_9GAMM|nr:DsrH/TusB family sulfur metabolism protein [Alkalimonas sp. MEB108]MEE2003325.1 DsrH/TusB family sulfur metabolism protein [Alkalimonas sp. MEB108]
MTLAPMKLVHWIYPELPAQSLLAQLAPQDLLLLRQDGCYSLALPWPELPCRLRVLATDLTARGLNAKAPWQTIDDSDWVELAAQASQVVLWPH